MNNRRRALLSIPTGGGLPPEYQQVEYIQTVQDVMNGYTNSINTLLVYKNVKKVVIKLKYLKITAYGSMCCSAYLDQTRRGNPWFAFGGNEDVFSYSGFDSISCNPPYNRTQAYNNIIEPTITFSTQNNSIITFPCWSDSSWSVDCEIFYAKFYGENDELLRDYIPCYRKSDNEPGMYDLINNVFYTNAGTGTFIVGNDIN